MSQSPRRDDYDVVTRAGAAGLWDRSPRGVLELTGRDRVTFLHGMVSNDVAALTPGQGCRAAFLDSTGHILADLFICCRPDSLLIETDTRCLERLHRTLDTYLIMEKVRIRDVSADWAILSLQGDGAAAILERAGGVPSSGFALPSHHTPTGGLDLWLPASEGDAVRQPLLAAGAVPVSLAAQEALRVEAGRAVWGRELDETILLPEAELTEAVSFTKGCYIGQEIVARIAARGHTNRVLRAILMADGAAVPQPGDTVHVPEDAPEAGREIGRITSAVSSPRFGGRALALSYVRREHCAPGTAVAVHLRQPGGAAFAAGGEVRLRGNAPDE